MEKINELHKIEKNSTKDMKIIDFIHMSIKKILSENACFENELDFQYKLFRELKNMFKEFDIDNIYAHLEYNELNYYLGINMNMEVNRKKASVFWTSDIAIEFDDRYYIIELKYGHDRTPTYGGISLSQAVIGFDRDINKVQSLVNKFENIDCGYCILLTAEKEYVKNYTTDENNIPLKIIWEERKWIDVEKLSYYIDEIKNNIRVRRYFA
jgi:hypothetical protein